MKRFLGLGLSVVALAACSPGDAPATDAKAQEASLIESIIVTEGHIRPPLGGKDVTAGYFTMVTPTDDALVGARADFADVIELHDHIMADGMMQMRKVEDVPTSAGVPVSFQPHGLHLMIFGVKDIAEGETRKVTLVFRSGAEIETDFSVSAP